MQTSHFLLKIDKQKDQMMTPLHLKYYGLFEIGCSFLKCLFISYWMLTLLLLFRQLYCLCRFTMKFPSTKRKKEELHSLLFIYLFRMTFRCQPSCIFPLQYKEAIRHFSHSSHLLCWQVEYKVKSTEK